MRRRPGEWLGLAENKGLIHIEELAAAKLNHGEAGGEDWDENEDADGVGQHPMFDGGDVVGEEEKAEEIGDENQAGFAFELGIGAGKWDFAEIHEQAFGEKGCACNEDYGVESCVAPAEEMKCEEEGEWREPRQREGVEDATGERSCVLGIGGDPHSEDPVGAEVGRHFEGESDAD